MKFPTTSVIALIVSCCILTQHDFFHFHFGASAQQLRVSHDEDFTKEHNQPNLNPNPNPNRNPNHDPNLVEGTAKTSHRLLQYFNTAPTNATTATTANNGSSSSSNGGGHWVPFGDDIQGKAAGDLFGSSVAMSKDGNFIIVGGIRNDDNGRDTGHTQVFEYKEEEEQWEQVGGDIVGEEKYDQSGWSVDINDTGDVVVIGTPYNDENGSNSGHARIYRLIDGQWVQDGEDLDGTSQDEFGRSVAISGNGRTIIIGGPGNDHHENGKNCGRAEIYTYNADTQEWKGLGFYIIGEYQDDLLGYSVDINDTGDVVIMGAPKVTGINGNAAGYARVYQYTDGRWVRKGNFDIHGKMAGDRFGQSVAISGDGERAVISGPYNNNENGTKSGHVQVFAYNADKKRWEQVGGDILGENANDNLGETAVGINYAGDVVIVGASTNGGNGANAGHARIYRLMDGQWVQQGGDIDGKNIGDEFGFSADISGDGEIVIIGGPNNDDNGIHSGHVRAFVFQKPTAQPSSMPSIQPSSKPSIQPSPMPSIQPSSMPSIQPSFSNVPSMTPSTISDQPTAQPSSMPSIQPSFKFSNVPSMTPSTISDQPTIASSTCNDSPLKVLTGKGKKSAKTCEIIAKKTKKFCGVEKIKTHCPDTCDACNDYGTSDSIGKFLYQGKVRDCKWLRGAFVTSSSKFLGLCENDGISGTCREACSLICTTSNEI